ncbi:hypothetical protein DBV05_g994 [Lasiodiplodia theobromae]|uniref:Uncharacterized protein n=2 Tax=Lasiodiplodia theobromae TaxID=45133 RepID=A0A5N5DWT7_9PEZI|nr:hypothetical protein DBV05_g994 [Lasiodiplodia theobromae]
MFTTLLLLSSLAAAAPLPAPASSQQCRCAVMPASTPFFPSLQLSPSSASSHRLVTDSCAALGPQLQAWREAPADRAADEAVRLEEWIVGQEDKVAKAASDLLWGKRPIPTAAALVSARKQRSDDRDAKPKGRIVCRSVEVTEEAVSSFEDALYADTTSAEKARKFEAQESPDTKHQDDCDEKPQKMSLFDEIMDAWKRPERHMFALKLVVFVLIMLCMFELGDDICAWIRRRNARRAFARLSGDEKAWFKPGLAPIAEVEEEDDTQLP